MKKIDYFMSTSSPWTYLGSQLITEMATAAGSEINIYPVNFGQIFPASGGLPLPKRAPQRQAYRLMELQRWKKTRGSRMHIEPSNFPSASPISSLCIIAARERGDNALTLSNAILAALWEDDRNIDDPEVLKDICFENELDGNQILTTAKTSQIEKLFETDTNGAIKKGVFGAPTYLIDGEIFWGQDRLDFVSEKLGI